MNLISAQADFLQVCRRRNLSDHTVRAYRQDLNDLAVWAKRVHTPRPISRDGIERWMSDMAARELAPGTIKRRVACLKVFCRWLEDEGRIDINPFTHFQPRIKLPKRLPRNLHRSELKLLIGDHTKRGWKHMSFNRLTLLISLELLFATGMRVGELCSITVDNIDIDTGVITIRGKGNRERKAYIVNDDLDQILRYYLAKRESVSPLTNNLLVTARGAAATPNQVRKWLHDHVERIGLQRKVTPHMIRHTTATQLLENGVDIRFVQKLLGHASISTTEIYTHVSDTKLHEAIRNADLRGALK